MNSWTFLCIFIIVLPSCCRGFSAQRQLRRVESLNTFHYQIAPRPKHFFDKRGQSPSLVPPQHIEFDDHLLLTLQAYNTTFHLNLEPNLDLFHSDAVLHQYGQSEKLGQHKVYKGNVIAGGWARITMQHIGNTSIIQGAFKYKNDLYHIKDAHHYHLVKQPNDPVSSASSMVIYRDSDMLSKRQDPHAHQCGFDNLIQPTALPELTKRFEQGCPTDRKINFMGAVADCTYVQYYKSRDAARIQIINDFNMASAVFEETFNVALGLINITIMDPTCPTNINTKRAWNRACDANYSLSDRLSDFSLWRSTMSKDGAGLWHLMTNCPTGVEVGLAWLKQLCNSGANIQKTPSGKAQYVSGAGVSAITRDEWKVVAHEIGHGFGAIHDCTSETCPCEGEACQCCALDSATCNGEGFLMSPISNVSAEHFSPCSVKTICSAFPKTGHCLADPQEHVRSIYELDVCGNGIKEQGEECDTSGVDTDCCDAKTCKLKKPAVCEDTNDSCCHQCQIRPHTHMCRPAATPCDLSEYCTGSSASCPDDLYLSDGVPCEDGKSCASGQCTSRDAQCLSRGFVMNITKSCESNNEECKMLCNKPGGKCILFSGSFIDGTPCGLGGRCLSGACQNGGPIGSPLFWVREHENIMIPVCIIAFLILCSCAFLLFWFGCYRCTGYKQKRHQNTVGLKDKAVNNDSNPLSLSSTLTPQSSTSSGLTVYGNNDITEIATVKTPTHL
ncbi:hypothetical protein INT47_012222 [Mucor saturninus]|uniref:Disintegrin and metalloproteinase domain-containing protein B n=1 Tax=Mucor saturninus TaxID=64648 RepID=A0A8H7RA29_9FUNG|nr:hypothetical protein INT47_012222 [Mucor saturninus]